MHVRFSTCNQPCLIERMPSQRKSWSKAIFLACNEGGSLATKVPRWSVGLQGNPPYVAALKMYKTRGDIRGVVARALRCRRMKTSASSSA